MSLRQPWTEKEDEILASLVNRYGTSNWILISEKFQARANTNSRTGKQCRQRWHNNLDPSITKRSWSLSQEQLMFQGHRKYGNKWAQIASELDNRTDSDVKNHFYAVIRKCLRRISKMFGQKNSTEKIKNLKPNILSRLLQNTNQKSSKQTSEALFKFILTRENLNIGSLDKKTRTLFQHLIERILIIVAEGGEQKVQKESEQILPKNQKSESKRSQRLLKMERQSSRKAASLKKEQKKKERKTKIKRSKPKKTSQRVHGKSAEKENKDKDEQKMQIQMPEVSIDKKSSKILSVFDSFSPSVGFRWVEDFDQKETPKDRKLWIREGNIEDTCLFPDFSIPDTPSGMRLRSNNGNDMLRILSSNDQRTIYVTPKNPTPGNVQNLFPNWTISHKLTTQQIDDERERIRKLIQRNNKEMK